MRRVDCFSAFKIRGFLTSRNEESIQKSWRRYRARERPEEAASTTVSGSTEESPKYRQQSQRQEGAEQSSGDSQGGHPTEREL